MSDTPVYDSTTQSATTPGAAVTAPPVVNSDSDLEARIAAIVEARIAGVRSEYDAKITALTEQHNATLATLQRGGPADLQPENSAGPGNTKLHTWGQWLQELAHNGLLTAAHVASAHGVSVAEAEQILAKL